MSDKRSTIDEAVASIESGMPIGIGGWGSRRKPMAFVQHHRADDLVLFRVPTSHLFEGVVGATLLDCRMRVSERVGPEGAAR